MSVAVAAALEPVLAVVRDVHLRAAAHGRPDPGHHVSARRADPAARRTMVRGGAVRRAGDVLRVESVLADSVQLRIPVSGALGAHDLPGGLGSSGAAAEAMARRARGADSVELVGDQYGTRAGA